MVIHLSSLVVYFTEFNVYRYCSRELHCILFIELILKLKSSCMLYLIHKPKDIFELALEEIALCVRYQNCQH